MTQDIETLSMLSKHFECSRNHCNGRKPFKSKKKKTSVEILQKGNPFGVKRTQKSQKAFCWKLRPFKCRSTFSAQAKLCFSQHGLSNSPSRKCIPGLDPFLVQEVSFSSRFLSLSLKYVHSWALKCSPQTAWFPPQLVGLGLRP